MTEEIKKEIKIVNKFNQKNRYRDGGRMKITVIELLNKMANGKKYQLK